MIRTCMMDTRITNLSEIEIARIIETENQSEVERLIPLIVYLVVISVTGIIGNGLVCYVYHPMCNTSSSRWFIYFLGVVNLLLCAILVPIEIATTFQQFTFINAIWCQVTTLISLWTLISLGFIFVIVAIDRYRKVCAPYDWQINTFKAKVLSGVLVGAAGIVAVPVVDVYKIYKVKLPNSDIFGRECSFRKEENGHSLKVIYIGFGMMLFVGSLLTICVLYCCIGVTIKKHTNKERTNQCHSSTLPGKPSHYSTTNMDDTPTVTLETKFNDNKENASTDINEKTATIYENKNIQPNSMRMKRTQRATFSMCLISVAFVICYLPLLSLMLVRNLISDFHEDMSDELRAVYKFFLRSGYLPCAINPFIYGCSDSKFRQGCYGLGSAIRRLFGYCKHREGVTQ